MQQEYQTTAMNRNIASIPLTSAFRKHSDKKKNVPEVVSTEYDIIDIDEENFENDFRNEDLTERKNNIAMISQTKLNRLATRQSNQSLNKKGVIKVIDQTVDDEPSFSHLNTPNLKDQDFRINSEKKDMLRKSIGRAGTKSKKDKSHVISQIMRRNEQILSELNQTNLFIEKNYKTKQSLIEDFFVIGIDEADIPMQPYGNQKNP